MQKSHRYACVAVSSFQASPRAEHKIAGFDVDLMELECDTLLIRNKWQIDFHRDEVPLAACQQGGFDARCSFSCRGGFQCHVELPSSREHISVSQPRKARDVGRSAAARHITFVGPSLSEGGAERERSERAFACSVRSVDRQRDVAASQPAARSAKFSLPPCARPRRGPARGRGPRRRSRGCARLGTVEGSADACELLWRDARTTIEDSDRRSPRRPSPPPRPCRHISAHCRSGCGARGGAGSAARRAVRTVGWKVTAGRARDNPRRRRRRARNVRRSRTARATGRTRARVRMSSSIAVISSMVAIIRSRSSSGSTLSARMRSEASGVRRSWPIAPSMRSFSSSRATTRAFIALKARMARRRSAGPRGSTATGSPRPPKPPPRGEVAQRPREPSAISSAAPRTSR